MPSIKHEDLSNNSDQNNSLDSSTIESAPSESNQPTSEPKEKSATKQLPDDKINSPRNITILATILVALLALVIGAVQVFAPSFLKPTNILFGNKSAKVSSSQSNSASSLTAKSSSSSSSYSFNSSQSDFNISEFYAQSSQSSRSQSSQSQSSKSFSSQNSVLISSSNASSATQVISKAVINEVMPVIGRSSVIPNQVNCNDNNPKTNSKLVCILNFASPIQTGDLTDPELILSGNNKDNTQFQKIGCNLNREDSTYSSLSCSTDNLTVKEGDYSLTFGNGVPGAGGYQQKLSQTLVVK